MSQTRTFTLADQTAFAALSGDYNPMHLDPLAARRMLFGKPVVHGVHVVLWVLDAYLATQAAPAPARTLAALKATFTKPVGVGEAATWAVQPQRGVRQDGERQSNEQNFVVLVENAPVIKIKSVWADVPPDATISAIPAPQASPAPPRPREQDDLHDAKGELLLWLDEAQARAHFAALGQCLTPLQMAELLALTRLVGMECPGLNSVFSEFEVNFAPNSTASQHLAYHVVNYDERFQRVQMNLAAPMLRGSIRAFVRPPVHLQPSYRQIVQWLVSNGKLTVDNSHLDTASENSKSKMLFAGQRALVVGGSRGLGEVVVKLLSAGGADVRLTYHRGEAEAKRIVTEINEDEGTRGKAACFALDVLQPDASQRSIEMLVASGWTPTHLYYLATPFIFDATSGAFSARLFRQFCDYYVTGFLDLLNWLKPHGLRAVLYPSSVALDHIPANMGEYAAAKAAGEVLCAFVEQHSRDLRIYRPRLPRLATDQTASLLPVENADPLAVMFAHLCQLRRLDNPL